MSSETHPAPTGRSLSDADRVVRKDLHINRKDLHIKEFTDEPHDPMIRIRSSSSPDSISTTDTGTGAGPPWQSYTLIRLRPGGPGVEGGPWDRQTEGNFSSTRWRSRFGTRRQEHQRQTLTLTGSGPRPPLGFSTTGISSCSRTAEMVETWIRASSFDPVCWDDVEPGYERCFRCRR